ncbi:Predicted Rossmann fold nucleotide-binding protein DprA/Smf involved in DNA uptake [Kandleria vitulina]|jgi:predicted Rossmann fold nucleotide-binding protein DprA/Smf involved in DNA uptake|uniref:Predicted Rossmann fold nucleotide-binding protein DprA/Smf involved in DNA uptake n=1 Tax=Kandleria vitulina TaxID=1630 RepID=A0A1H2PWI2_9FIRM|nr:DNA-processing protein DprA [Kandleria vitulina]SDV99220.1 Predicted Rossmann fold nucleotide-binding protein DprA/Smf involved in DNA uptake [Kandleria vitulina]HAD22554.1 hypothetical protein [Kandleria vitulina]
MKIYLNLNSFSAILYCSTLIPTSIPPLTYDEWYEVEKKIEEHNLNDVSRLMGMNEMTLTNVVGLDAYLSLKIIARATLMAEMFYALYRLEQEGIQVTTKYEDNYPKSLLKLKKRMPPVLFYAGDLSLIKEDNVSIVGPQTSSKKLKRMVKMAVSKLARERRTLISGDIKGVDQYALKQMLSSGGNVVGVLSDHLIDKIKEYKRYISKGKLCLISAIDPYAFFDVTNALDRNIYVCGLSSCQIIAAVLINSGAVWFTAIQNLHYNWTRQLVMEVPEYNGNLRLEEMGAIPISRDDLQSPLSIDEIIEKNNVYGEDEQPQIDQMSIFEFIGEKNG